MCMGACVGRRSWVSAGKNKVVFASVLEMTLLDTCNEGPLIRTPYTAGQRQN